MNPKRFLFILLFLFLQKTFAQNLPTKHYTVRDGLAQMQAMSLLEDKRGILWIGTKNGLSKFDGIRFVNYRRSEGFNLPNDFIGDLNEDKNGNIWISTLGGICKFDGAKFEKYPLPVKKEEGGTIIITKSNQIYIFEHTERKLFILKNNTFENVKIGGVDFKDLMEYGIEYNPSNDKLYISDYEKNKANPLFKIYEYENNQFVLKESNHNDGTPYFVKYGDLGIIQTYHNPINQSNTVYFIPTKSTTKIKVLHTINSKIEIFATLPFNFPFQFQNNLMVLFKNSKEYQKIASNYLELGNVLQKDKTGIWAGTETGLWRIMENGIQYIPEAKDAVSWGLVEDKLNRVWSLHYNTDIPIKIHEGNKITNLKGYTPSLSQQLGKPFANLWYFKPIKDKYSNLWLASSDGLIHYDYKKFYLRFKNTYSFTLAEDTARNLIISSVNKGVNIVENKPPYKVTELRPKDGLHDNFQIMSIIIDQKGRHWYGSGKGLSIYDYDKKTFFNFEMSTDKVPFGSVIYLYQDLQGTIWVASRKGLYYYIEKEQRFIQYGKDKVFGPMQFIDFFDKTHIICGNHDSIFIIDINEFHRNKTEKYKTFNFSNGYLGIEPNQAGYLHTHDGKIWITSSDIISIFNPAEMDLNIYAPTPIISKIDSINISFSFNNSKNVIELPFGKSDDIRIDFQSLGFEKATHPRYSYRLDEGEWSKWQEEEFVNLSNLASGTYKFSIKTELVGENGELKPKESSIYFKTSMYFWQSPNFAWYLLGLLTIVLSIFAFRWIREKNLRKNLLKQKRELEFLKVAASQAQMNPHFIFNVLGLLQGKISKGNVEEADKSLVKISALIRNFLESTNINPEKRRRSSTMGEIELEKEIELLKLFVDFEHEKANESFDYQFNISENVKINDLQVPSMIVQPIVENAIKRGILNLSENVRGNLKINIDYKDKKLIFEIIDMGVGRKKAAELKASMVSKHKSRGLELVRKRIEILKDAGLDVSLDYQDVIPHGTKATIIMNFDE